MMRTGIARFADGYAWVVVVDGHIREQGYSEDEEVARAELKASRLLWQTHDYQSDY